MRVIAFTAKRARVEMVPLIDMFFLLLVFFIFGVFSMTVQQGIVVDLPSASTGASTKEQQLTISLTAAGQLFLNQEPVTQETLEAQLAEAHAAATPPLIIINADRQVAHGLVIGVLDAVRRAGLQRVSFQTHALEERS